MQKRPNSLICVRPPIDQNVWGAQRLWGTSNRLEPHGSKNYQDQKVLRIYCEGHLGLLKIAWFYVYVERAKKVKEVNKAEKAEKAKKVKQTKKVK